MYNDYFGFKEAPFSIAPDPRYIYMSDQHREALAHLLYGFNSDGGFVLLTGEVGTGKTTICRCLLEQVPETSAIAFIYNPKLTAEELLATICDEFGIAYPEGNRSIKVYIDLLNAFLLDAHANGRQAVLIIDEAQNLGSDVLEQLRLLTNLETNQFKLLQIILLGQPELRDKLAEQQLRQLSQRIIARYHIEMLSKKDIQSYVNHRLLVAGITDKLFSDGALDELYSLSKGIPRLINVICDRALLGTFAQNKKVVSKKIIKEAAREIFGESNKTVRHSSTYAWLLPILVIAVVGVVLAASRYNFQETVKEPAALPAAGIPDREPSIEVSSPPVEFDQLSRPELISDAESRTLAFKDLFSLWNIDGEWKGIYPCDYVELKGYRCLSGLTTLNTLRALNRPAIVKLFDRQGNAFHALIRELRTNSALLTIGAETKEIALDDLTVSWLGEYVMLWKLPPQYNGILQSGIESPLVPWLNVQLSLIQKTEPLPLRKNIFDDDLMNRVKKFQLSAGLIPDGIVGPHTIIHMQSATDDTIPKLVKTAEEVRESS